MVFYPNIFNVCIIAGIQYTTPPSIKQPFFLNPNTFTSGQTFTRSPSETRKTAAKQEQQEQEQTAKPLFRRRGKSAAGISSFIRAGPFVYLVSESAGSIRSTRLEELNIRAMLTVKDDERRLDKSEGQRGNMFIRCCNSCVAVNDVVVVAVSAVLFCKYCIRVICSRS